MTIREILSKYRYSIVFVLMFVLIENIAWIIEPTFFGKLLDALIGHFYDHETVDYFIPLAIWIVIYFLNVLGGTLHRFFSGGLYSKMYAELATQVVSESLSRGDLHSKMLVRTELVKEYITFFKERVPEMFWQFSASAGAIIAVFFYDYRIGLVCLAVVVPIAYINNTTRRKVTILQKNLHDCQEEVYRLIENRDTSKLNGYYESMIAPRKRIARLNSMSYSTVKILLVIIFIVVLFICVDLDNFSTGKIYSIVAYLWTFIGQTEYLPELMESIGSVRELDLRFVADNETSQSEASSATCIKDSKNSAATDLI